jgi:hypothetical protein
VGLQAKEIKMITEWNPDSVCVCDAKLPTEKDHENHECDPIIQITPYYVIRRKKGN